MNKDEKEKKVVIDDSQLDAEWEAIMVRVRELVEEKRKADPNAKPAKPNGKAG